MYKNMQHNIDEIPKEDENIELNTLKKDYILNDETKSNKKLNQTTEKMLNNQESPSFHIQKQKGEILSLRMSIGLMPEQFVVTGIDKFLEFQSRWNCWK